jgi:hypothetical protein
MLNLKPAARISHSLSDHQHLTDPAADSTIPQTTHSHRDRAG